MATQRTMPRSSMKCISLIASIYFLGIGDLRADTYAQSAAELFEEGKGDMAAGRFAEACEKFAKSYKRAPSGGAILHLAICYRSAGKILFAWSALQKALRFARLIDRTDREAVAEEYLAELAEGFPRVSLRVAEETANLPELMVTIDGVPIPPDHWSAGVPVDSGAHVLVASAPGRVSLRTELQIGPLVATNLTTIPALAPVQANAGPSSPEAPSSLLIFEVSKEAILGEKSPLERPVLKQGAPSAPSPPRFRATWSTTRIAGAALGGAGLTALAAGVVLGAHAGIDNASSKYHCDGDICTGEGRRLRDEAATVGNISAAIFIAGGVASATGVTLWLLGAPPRDGKPAAPLSVSLGTGGQSLWVAGSF